MLGKAAELGIVQSKVNVVGHSQVDLRHLRYVGVPHAAYIYENKITLDEYLDVVRQYNYNKRLTVSAGSASYEIYFVKAEENETTVPVPSGSDYTVCSDNATGYIVTIKLPSQP